jgi:hypothetical protein
MLAGLSAVDEFGDFDERWEERGGEGRREEERGQLEE